MDKMPKISIIVPVYNAEKYLAPALDSVLDQSFTDIEVVCINDGSTDGSGEILERYQKKDNRVKVIKQKNNGGSAARNAGIKHSTGSYIMFLDSDDIYARGIIASAYDRAIETDADIVFYNFARFVGRPTNLARIDRTTPQVQRDVYTKENNRKRYFNDFAILTWNKLIRKSLLTDNKVYFDTSLSHDHDVDFSIRLMLAADTISYVDKTGYYYRLDNAQSLTSTKYKDPTNVLRILITLNSLIKTEYTELKQSFDNYVVDMIVGAIDRQQYHRASHEEVFNFAVRTAIPQFELAGRKDNYFYKQEQLTLLKVIMGGDYNELLAYNNTYNRKLRRVAKKVHSMAQRFIPSHRV